MGGGCKSLTVKFLLPADTKHHTKRKKMNAEEEREKERTQKRKVKWWTPVLIPVITLNVSGLNTPNKRQLAEWVLKHYLPI